jgi:hypothetical protein
MLFSSEHKFDWGVLPYMWLGLKKSLAIKSMVLDLTE